MNHPMTTATRLRQTTSAVTMLSVLPHLLCCGIPAIAALIALGSTVGLAASLAGNPFYQFVDAYHTELVLLAIASVAFSGVMNFIAYRIDCRAAEAAAKTAVVQGHCNHADCTPKKNTSLKLFAVSCLLLALDLTWFYTEEHVLGLHHHGAEAHAHHHD